jgi:pimeloyl-ACP methyl ester carboxylesterase
MASLKKFGVPVLTIILLVLLFSFYGKLHSYRNSFDRREVLIEGSIPARIYLPETQKPPIVIVAHGFTGDKEIMQSLVHSLVRDGFAVLAFDFRGHGQNDTAFDHNRLQEDMRQVVDFAKNLNENMPPAWGGGTKEVDTGRIAVAGHSMGGGAIVEYALGDPDIGATVPIAGVGNRVNERLPKNLFIIYAERDPPSLHEAARRMLENSTSEDQALVANRTYGSFERGSARRMSMVEGEDHITILFSADAQGQIIDWLRKVWGMPARLAEVSDPTMGWMGLMYVMSFLLFFCCCSGLSWYLPAIPDRAGRGITLDIAAFAVVCFIVLFVNRLAPPLSFITMPVGSHLISYTFVIGIIYFLLASRRGNIDFSRFTSNPARTLFAAFTLFLFTYLTFGTIATEVWSRQHFTGQRLLWALMIFPFLLPFFIAFEASFKRGSVLVASVASLIGVCISLGMLVLGIVLGVTEGFLMLIIIPMAIFNVVFQLFSIYVYHLTKNYFITALFNAMLMAWQYAVLFPIS